MALKKKEENNLKSFQQLAVKRINQYSKNNMLTLLVRHTGTNPTPVFTLYVHRVTVFQWEKKMVIQI